MLKLLLKPGVLLALGVVIAGWIHGVGGTSINGSNGPFTTGSGLSINQEWLQPLIGPWDPYNTNNGVITQTTGARNVLRNASLSSWDHHRFMTQDNESNTYKLGIASFTATINNGSGGAGNRLNVSSPSGNLQLFQRVTDAISLTTNAVTTNVPGTRTVPTTCAGSPTACVLHFASTTGVANGMLVDDLTNPRAIDGATRVASFTGTTVTLTRPVGFTDNSNGNGQSPGVGSGDAIAFSTVARGTEIVGGGTCQPTFGATPTYPCYWLVSGSQNIASETMQSAGGWGAEGIYVIPVGTAGTTNYVACFTATGLTGTMNQTTLQCNVTGTISDIVFRFPIDAVDVAKINCSLSQGVVNQCVNTYQLIQPVTFDIYSIVGPSQSNQPFIVTKNACPMDVSASPPAGTNICKDDWTNATTDLVTAALPNCFYVGSPNQCLYPYTWVPTGITGNMAIEFHSGGNLTTGQYVTIDGFDLKVTPGAKCVSFPGGVYTVNNPPCFQYYPGPLEIPLVSEDIRWNHRFAQLVGPGWGSGGWNVAGTVGPIETTSGFAYSTTQFIATWPLDPLKCTTWLGDFGPPQCPLPNFYYQNPGDYKFEVAGGGEFVATGLSVFNYGLNSLQIIATSTGMTSGTAGYVKWGGGTGLSDFMLLDSASIGP